MNYNVFVYGTLKQGYGNNRLLNRAKYVGPAITVSSTFRMIDGGFPLVFADGLFKVKGELFVVSDEETMQNLDRLEGVPHLYTREKVEIRQAGDDEDVGWTAEAFMYVTNPRHGRYGTDMVPNDNNELEWN